MSGRHGYHIKDIFPGKFGEVGKIQEELEELKDAMEQGIKLMALMEVSDLYGAIEGFLEKHFPGVSMDDIRCMSYVTQRAFKNGFRQAKK